MMICFLKMRKWRPFWKWNRLPVKMLWTRLARWLSRLRQLQCKLGDLNLIIRIYIKVEGENKVHKVVLQPLYMHCGMHPTITHTSYTNINSHKHSEKKKCWNGNEEFRVLYKLSWWSSTGFYRLYWKNKLVKYTNSFKCCRELVKYSQLTWQVSLLIWKTERPMQLSHYHPD